MVEFTTFFIILMAALLSTEVAQRFKVPWVVALILGGMAIGPFGLKLFTPTPTIDFLAEIGLVFLMFIAGLEIRLSVFANLGKEIFVFSLLNGGIPMLVGILIGQVFGYSLIASLLIGIIFVSSSVAIIVPALENGNLLRLRLGKVILAATVFEDIISLIFLSIMLQLVDHRSAFPLPLLYLLLLATVLILRFVFGKAHHRMDHPGTPDVFFKIRRGFERFLQQHQGHYQSNLRIVIAILVGTVLLLELLGLHPIVAGFFAGVILSENVRSQLLEGKIRAMSYGLFIPIFFVVIGAETDVAIFVQAKTAGLLAAVVAVGSVLAKLTSGWLGAQVLGFSPRESLLAGAATVPQLSTTLAVAFVGLGGGLVDQPLLAALVALSVVTTLVSPFAVKLASRGVVGVGDGG